MGKGGCQNLLYGLILAGGSGVRLWPLSRASYPKQLLKLFGQKTLIEQTFFRLKKIIPVQRIYIITSENFAEDINFQLRNLKFVKENLIIEPAQKNTAPAIALASQKIFNLNKSAIILSCPSDHLISPDSKFIEAVKTALLIGKNDFLITFGLIPSPRQISQEFGYIKPNYKKLKDGCFEVEKFIEKPDLETIKKLIKEKCFLNSGIFLWKAEIILKELKKFLPKIYRAVSSYQNLEKFSKIYQNLEPVSIDKGVLEHSQKIRVRPVNFKWQDIGSWNSLYRLSAKNSAKNVFKERVFSSDCQSCLIYGAPKRIIAAIGLKDLIVVDTEDALLVADREKTSQLKNIFEKIKNNNLSQYLQHPTVYRPWGFFTLIEEGDNFKVKKLVVKPGEKLSLQFHNKRTEHWTVLRGRAKVKLNDSVFFLKPHQSIDIPRGAKHCLENFGKKPLEIIEIQNGQYLGEDDIIRIEDKYGRLN